MGEHFYGDGIFGISPQLSKSIIAQHMHAIDPYLSRHLSNFNFVPGFILCQKNSFHSMGELFYGDVIFSIYPQLSKSIIAQPNAAGRPSYLAQNLRAPPEQSH